MDPTALPRQVAPAPCNETCGNCAAWPRAAPRGRVLDSLRLARRAGAVRLSRAKVTGRRSCDARRRRGAPADRGAAARGKPDRRDSADLHVFTETVCLHLALAIRASRVLLSPRICRRSVRAFIKAASVHGCNTRLHSQVQGESVPDGIHTWHAVRAAYHAGLQAGRRVRRAAAARSVAAGRALRSRRRCSRAAARARAPQPPRGGPGSAESRQPARARPGARSAEHARCDRLRSF